MTTKQHPQTFTHDASLATNAHTKVSVLFKDCVTQKSLQIVIVGVEMFV